MAFKTCGWWRVQTENPNSERGDRIELGMFYGQIDDVALSLADKQRGFWSEGKLYFRPINKPEIGLPKKVKRKSVNVVLDMPNVPIGDELPFFKRILKGRPVTVSDCNLYGAVTLTRKV
jgi:hypothetical protein